MSLSRVFQSEPFLGLRHFNRMFDDALRGRITPTVWNMPNDLASLSPRLDLKENPEGNTMTASFELPGMTKDDVNIELHGDRLIVSGERKSSSERTENEGNYILREQRFGKFAQSLQIPPGTEAENIKASVADGILTVTFPKAIPSQPEPKKITVE